MDPVTEPVVDEQIWRGWVQKGKDRERRTAARARVVVAIVIAMLVAVGMYQVLMRP